MATKAKTKAKKSGTTVGAAAAPKRQAAARKTTKSATAARKVAVAVPRGPRRAIFIDVENTSSEADLVRVLEELNIDHSARPTETTAVGNWRTAGQRVARRLASLGAKLVHSAPVTGVRDWSDLWIATAAGCWLGQAAPGDALEIVSDDRAFDAVGDVAVHLGIVFRRVSHRSGGAAKPAPAEEGAKPRRGRSGRRRRGQRRKPTGSAAPSSQATPAPKQSTHVDEAQPASPEAIHEIVSELSGGRTGGWVNLDVLESALKARGFARPPGSPRLVTRLRKLKDFEVSSHGTVRLAGGAH